MRLNHRQLEAFRAVIDTGSVTEAASRLHITQPSASRLIADLEETIGYALFLRRKKRLLPTAEAIALYEEVDRSFIGLGAIAEAAKNIGNYSRSTLHIAAMPALGLTLLPDLISKYCKDNPDVSVNIKIQSSPRILQRVASQQFDIGLAETELKHPSVISRTLNVAPLVAILPSAHPLLAKQVLEPSDFEDQQFISLGSDYMSRQKIDAAFQAHNVTRKFNIDSQFSMVVGKLVSIGAGVSIIDYVTAKSLLDSGLVETRPFLPEIPFSFRALLSAQRPVSPLVQSFLDITKDALDRLIA